MFRGSVVIAVLGGWSSLLWLCATPAALAVDRSKFRTCQQTSFCRRHRRQQPEQSTTGKLYQYKLLPESVHFHVPPKHEQQQHEEQDLPKKPEAAPSPPEGMWQALQRRFLGTGGSPSTDPHGKEVLDPYVRGPTPTLTGTLQNTATLTSSNQAEFLQWSVTALADGLVRMRITERYGEKNQPYQRARVTYDELVLEADGIHPAEHAVWIRSTDGEGDAHQSSNALLKSVVPADQHDHLDNYMALQYGDAPDTPGSILLIRLAPFAVSLFRESNLAAGPVVVLGGQEQMHFEIRRRHPDAAPLAAAEETSSDSQKGDEAAEKKPEKEIVGYWEDGLAIYADGTREERQKDDDEAEHRHLTEESDLDTEGMWEEHFHSHVDSKPFGPMSVGLDITFPQSHHLYGIPEHASSAVLQSSMGENPHYKDPYRLYNLDVFEYELDETMALYGNVPLLVSHSAVTGSAAAFWFNPTETFVDVELKSDSSSTHWISESGIIDVFLLSGPTPKSLYRQYATLTGVTPLPPMFSLGYHQCRWNYNDEKDVNEVHGKFEELDYPYDVLWLDIEHTDGKRYFTWDSSKFPHPKEMQQRLAAQGRHMVTIIDPHMKRDDNYYIHKEATAKGLYIKDKDGMNDYDGWCWPGSSSYLDFTAEHVRAWWADQFQYSKYHGSTPSLFTWNDMNEPSVFNGPEVSMQKDLKNLKGEEHREWHNLYGMLFHRSTAEGQIKRNGVQEVVRPFVLSRAFFAGSQRYGAIWTGDNTAVWSHLEVAAPMLLGLNTAALSFVGADVGGFFGNPDAELFTRWMQAGAYTPFFRGHAHHDSKRREPWMFDEDTLVRLRRAAMARYALLPYWYSVFQVAETTGMPVMRMMWMEFPETPEIFALDNEYMIGSDLLVKPVTAAGVVETEVVFPTDHLWYHADTLALVSSKINQHAVEKITVPSDINTTPVFQRGGSILPRKLRLRRSTMMMKKDPYSLYVALDYNYKAEGHLYMDDETTFGYLRKSEFGLATFSADFSNAKSAKLTCDVNLGPGWYDMIEPLSLERMIERIVIMGVKKAPQSIHFHNVKLDFIFDAESQVLVVRKPELSALVKWTLEFTF